MLKQAVTAGVSLLLLGCQAQADDDAPFRAIYAAHSEAMCARTDSDRTAALTSLAAAVENYRGKEDDDTATGVVEAAAMDFDRAQCPHRPARPSNPQ